MHKRKKIFQQRTFFRPFGIKILYVSFLVKKFHNNATILAILFTDWKICKKENRSWTEN